MRATTVLRTKSSKVLDGLWSVEEAGKGMPAFEEGSAFKEQGVCLCHSFHTYLRSFDVRFSFRFERNVVLCRRA
jgi:hypothetical protein